MAYSVITLLEFLASSLIFWFIIFLLDASGGIIDPFTGSDKFNFIGVGALFILISSEWDELIMCWSVTWLVENGIGFSSDTSNIY